MGIVSIYLIFVEIPARIASTAASAAIMPLFGGKKKPESKKAEEVVKPRTPTVEDKYDLKDVLGT